MRTLWVARRNLRLYRGRLTAFFLIVVLGSVLATAAATVVAAAARSANEAITEDVALRSIDIVTDEAAGTRQLAASDVADIRKVAHVERVDPWLASSVLITTKQADAILIDAAIPEPGTDQRVEAAERPQVFPLRPGEIALPATADGIDLQAALGQVIPVEYTVRTGASAGTSATTKLRVVALLRPSSPDAFPTGYAHASHVVTWAAARAGVPAGRYLEAVGYPRAAVLADRAQHVDAVATRLRDLGFDAAALKDRLRTLPAGLQLLQVLGYVALGLLVLYSMTSGAALANSLIRERTRDIGLLAALGFSRSAIRRVFLTELAYVGGVGSLAGLLSGALVAVALGAVASGKTLLGVTMSSAVAFPPPWLLAALLVLPVLAVLAGGLSPAARAARLSPDDALRGR